MKSEGQRLVRGVMIPAFVIGFLLAAGLVVALRAA